MDAVIKFQSVRLGERQAASSEAPMPDETPEEEPAVTEKA
jgi:hypothetical protein